MVDNLNKNNYDSFIKEKFLMNNNIKGYVVFRNDDGKLNQESILFSKDQDKRAIEHTRVSRSCSPKSEFLLMAVLNH